MLMPGKRYWWVNCGHYKEGIFTGRYNERNGQALVQDKIFTWSVPIKWLHPVVKKKGDSKNG